ncbi:hypothetical protein CHS0354_005008 [Potamilus streckersoni]|uniref:Uncharacterized protein n=1 Tax=Potamilus streckersoni TaxID=2493646 RepID=A0AAE0SSJ5_9BIVA|nr:hypothetical protein CHS0354_005008 [Potamilus streckersoni]
MCLLVGYKRIASSITLNLKLPGYFDIKVPENYAMIEKEAKNALREFYISKMGQTFETIFILSIRRGSLIVDYVIVTKNSDDALLMLAEANSELATGQNITLAGQRTTTMGLTVEGKECTVYAKYIFVFELVRYSIIPGYSNR